MPNPYSAYLVFGIVNNSLGGISPLASIKVTTSIGEQTYFSDSDGIYMFDISDIGYVAGEVVTLNTKDIFNNEQKLTLITVSGGFNQENITLALRTEAYCATGYSPKSILHSIGNSPITSDNPLPIEIIGQSDVIDLVNNPQHEWVITRQDRQPDSETVTMANGDVYTRTFTYTNDVMTKRTKWVRQ